MTTSVDEGSAAVPATSVIDHRRAVSGCRSGAVCDLVLDFRKAGLLPTGPADPVDQAGVDA